MLNGAPRALDDRPGQPEVARGGAVPDRSGATIDVLAKLSNRSLDSRGNGIARELALRCVRIGKIVDRQPEPPENPRDVRLDDGHRPPRHDEWRGKIERRRDRADLREIRDL